MRRCYLPVALWALAGLGQAQTPELSVMCSQGLTGDGCRNAQTSVRVVLEVLRPALRSWRFIVVPDTRWADTCKAFRLKPCVPAFSNLKIRATYLNSRLAVLIDGTFDEEMAHYTRLTGENRLEWVLAHEFGHILCGTADQNVAEDAGLRLRGSGGPAGCPVDADRKRTMTTARR